MPRRPCWPPWLPPDGQRKRWHRPPPLYPEGVKILLVEDEPEIGALVRDGLGAEGFEVDYCEDGDSGMKHAIENVYDAVVLDIMLPGKSGLEILRKLREGHNMVPVIIITARGESDDRIEGLNLGADDYLPKPFFVEELIARLRAIWRRSTETGMSQLSVGTLSANLMSREVRRSGTLIDMTPKEFSLLSFLMRSPGRVLTRTQILEQVWGYHFDPGTNLVDVYIRRLRTKIDLEGEQPLIETLRGVGYRMLDPDNADGDAGEG